MTTRALLLSTVTLGLAGCLGSPDLKACHEFPLGTEGCAEGCDVYCDLMLDACPDVFETEASCRSACALEPVMPYPDGDFGDEAGNSLSCRITQAQRGACDEARLQGTQVCVGASCEDYCALMMAHCQGAYPTVQNCEAACASLPRGAGSGDNTVECRFEQAERAESDPSACEAASLNGGGVCGSPCDTYCLLLEEHCTGADALYASRAECMDVCALLDDGGRFDDWDFEKERDTVQCRTYHAGPPAAAVPSTHCPHAGVYNSEHCGIAPPAGTPQPADWPCVTFCDVAVRTCGSYPDVPTCVEDCATFEEVLNADPVRGPDIFPVSTRACPQ